MKFKSLLILLFLFISYSVNAQKTVDSTVVKSTDGITKEILHILSGKKGEERNWDWFKQLFLPEVSFTVVINRKDKETIIRTLSLEEFIKSSTENSKQSSFHEIEIGKKTEEYNGIAHVFQTYKATAENFEEEGINSIQLIYKNDRWWVSHIMWTSNRNGVNIPEKYKNN
jgi:hypothetical protein